MRPKGPHNPSRTNSINRHGFEWIAASHSNDIKPSSLKLHTSMKRPEHFFSKALLLPVTTFSRNIDHIGIGLSCHGTCFAPLFHILYGCETSGYQLLPPSSTCPSPEAYQPIPLLPTPSPSPRRAHLSRHSPTPRRRPSLPHVLF